MKIGVLALLVIGIFVSGNGSFSNFTHAVNPKSGTELLSGIVVALTGAFVALMAGIHGDGRRGSKRPGKEFTPQSFCRCLICMAVYILVNQAHLYVLPVEKMGFATGGSDAMAAALGHTGSHHRSNDHHRNIWRSEWKCDGYCTHHYAMGKGWFILPAGWGRSIRSIIHRRMHYGCMGVWTCLFILPAPLICWPICLCL